MKKTLGIILSAFILTASTTACGQKSDSQQASENYIYGQIESISGNDMVLLMAEYNENATTDENSEAGKNTDSESSGNRPDKGELPEGFDPSQFGNGEKPEGFTRPENGEMPEGFDSSKFGNGEMPEGFTRPENGEMPEGFDSSKFENGEMPEGFTRPENGEMPEEFDPSQFGGGSKGSRNSKYKLTGEQEEFLIPVGTVVTTNNGAESDFSALAKGNVIKCDITKDKDGNSVINAIWIVE